MTILLNIVGSYPYTYMLCLTEICGAPQTSKVNKSKILQSRIAQLNMYINNLTDNILLCSLVNYFLVLVFSYNRTIHQYLFVISFVILNYRAVAYHSVCKFLANYFKNLNSLN